MNSEKAFKAIHLPIQRFNDKMANRQLFRDRQKDKEVGGEYSCAPHVTELERLKKISEFNGWKDSAPAQDNKMRIRPDWKEEHKEKWVSLVGSIDAENIRHLNSCGSSAEELSFG